MRRGLLAAALIGAFQSIAIGQTVSNLEDSGPGSLRQAIADAVPGAMITCSVSGTIGLSTVADSTYGPSALLIDKNITIVGNGITISRSNNAGNIRIFYVKTNCTLELSNVTVADGIARGGNGEHNLQGGCGGGGAGLGAGIYNRGTLRIINCTFTGNQAIGGLGGYLNHYSCTYYWGAGGGGMGANGNCYYGAGGGGNGGLDYSANGSAGGYGGGGGGGGTSTSSIGLAGAGGVGGFGGGGGAPGRESYPYIKPSASGGFGGGASSVGYWYYGGTGGGGAGLGGAIFNEGGALAITNSTFSANSASGGARGGTIDFDASDLPYVRYGDGGNGYGGAVFNLNGSVSMVNATIASNTVSTGGGAIYNLQTNNVPITGTADVYLKNCILALTTGGNDAINDGGTFTGSTNLVQNSSSVPSGVVSLTSNPLLSSLQNNGGPTPTFYLKPGSPAIDVGENISGLTLDQRGSNRIVRGFTDLGSYEVSSNDAPTVNIAIPNQTITNFFTYSYTFPANTFLDADSVEGQTLTYTASDLPPGLSLNGTTRTISGRPQQVATFTVSIIATDNGIPNLSVTNTFILDVLFAPNTEPIFTAGPDQLVLENSSAQPAFNGNGTIVWWGWEPSYYASSQVPRPWNVSGIASLSAGSSHFVGANADGTVIAWGDNYQGQCNIPAGLNNVKAVAGGGSFSLALKNDGTIVGWGYQYGTIPTGITVKAIAAGYTHSLALKNDGTIVGWGNNYSGEINIPAGLSNVTAIAAAQQGSHSLALKADGTVVAWGYNYSGQCNVPAGLSDVVAVAAGGSTSLALTTNGTIVAWGHNGYGQLNVPANLPNVVAISMGQSKCAAVMKDGTVVVWGDDPYEYVYYSYEYPQPTVAGATAMAISSGDGFQYGTELVALQGSAWPWATDIKAGYGDEGWQTLNFIVTNDNPSLFSVQPTINTNGILFYTPAVNAFGVANVTASLHDNGGVEGGGIDTSSPITFTITVEHVNRTPVVMSPVADQLLYLGSPFSLTFPANTFSNWDAQFGETLAFTAQNIPAGLSLDGGTRTFAGLPTAFGQSSVSLTATDNGTPPLSATDNFIIIVTNTFAPGPNVGTLSLSNTIWSPNLNYNWQLHDAAGAAGIAYDVIQINGTLDLSDTSGFNINLWSLSSRSPLIAGPATNFNKTLPNTWTLVTTTEGIIGFEPDKLQIVTAAANGTAGFANSLGNGVFSTEVLGSNLVLNFLPSAPFAQTDPATAVAGTNATFHGVVNPNGRPTAVFFEFGTNLNFGSSVYVTNLPASRTPTTISFKYNGLDPELGYYCRIVAANTADLTYGTNVTFGTVALPDSLAPIVVITSPLANSSTNVATISMTGTARDDGRVQQLLYSLNGLSFSNIAFGNSAAFVNWSKSIKLKPGTNTVLVKATDMSGKQSAVVSRMFFYNVKSPLTVITNGIGSLIPTISTIGTPTNNAELLIGRPYTITAIPGANQVFSNWSGGLISTNRQLTFVMQSNLLLRANFTRNPFIDTAGTYNGLFYEKTNIAHHSSGFITMTLGTNFSFSGKLLLDGDTIPFGGKFSLDGAATVPVPRAHIDRSSLTLYLTNIADRVIGCVAAGTNWKAALEADRATFSSTNQATAYTNIYTMLIPGDGAAATNPTGYGYSTLSIRTNGSLSATIGLADNSAASQIVPISKNGEWPLYLQLYKSSRAYTNLLTTLVKTNKSHYRGSLIGWVTFTNNAPTGTVSWIKTGWTNAFYGERIYQ